MHKDFDINQSDKNVKSDSSIDFNEVYEGFKNIFSLFEEGNAMLEEDKKNLQAAEEEAEGEPVTKRPDWADYYDEEDDEDSRDTFWGDNWKAAKKEVEKEKIVKVLCYGATFIVGAVCGCIVTKKIKNWLNK